MRKIRLLWQLFPSYLLITLSAVLAIAVTLMVTGHRFYREQVRQDVLARARLVLDPILLLYQSGRFDEVDQLCKEMGRQSGTRLTVVTAAGTVVADSAADPKVMDNHRDRPEIRAALEGRTDSIVRWSHTLGQNLMYVALPLVADGRTVGALRAAVPVAAIEKAFGRVYVKGAVTVAVVILILAAVSLYLTRRLTQPLRQMQAGAERFAQGDFRSRVRVSHSQEIDALADSLNRMAAQLDERFQTIVRQHNEMQATFSSMSEGVLALDSGGRVLSMNQRAIRILGLEGAEFKNRPLLEVIRNIALQEILDQAISTGAPVEGDAVIPLAEGDIHLQIRGTPLQDASAKTVGAVIVLNDVSRLRRLENLRREFVANVSHELRTPITSIRGFVETLEDGAIDDPANARRFLGIVARQVERLGAIIEDLLLLSRFDRNADAAMLDAETRDVRGVLQGAAQACAAKAADKAVALEIEGPENLRICANATLLQQALVNLIDNAINYSERGSRVRIAATESATETMLAVQDWGCGIAPEHHGRIFERFYRVDKGRSRELGGTGLGLAIVKHIAQAHHGRVTVSSAPGQGSTFTLCLPRQRAASAPAMGSEQ